MNQLTRQGEKEGDRAKYLMKYLFKIQIPIKIFLMNHINIPSICNIISWKGEINFYFAIKFIYLFNGNDTKKQKYERGKLDGQIGIEDISDANLSRNIIEIKESC